MLKPLATVFFISFTEKSIFLCCLQLIVLLSFSGAQLQCSVERPCPGERVIFTCTIPSVGHQWDIPSLNINRDLLPLSHDREITDPPFQFNVTEVIPLTSITSTATVTATADLNGRLIVCRDGVRMVLEQCNTIKLSGELYLHAYKYLLGVSPVSILLDVHVHVNLHPKHITFQCRS